MGKNRRRLRLGEILSTKREGQVASRKFKVNPTAQGESFSFDLAQEGVLVGFSKNNAKKGDKVEVLFRGYLTTDEGESLFQILDEFGRVFLSKELGRRHLTLPVVRSCFVVVRKDSARVFVNPSFSLEVTGKKKVPPGTAVSDADIADIEALDITGVTVAPEEGFLFAYFCGWRPAIYFDLQPLAETGHKRGAQVRHLLARAYADTAFHEMFRADDSILRKMYEDGWYPFVRLVPREFRSLYKAYEAGFDAKEEEVKILKKFDAKAAESWLAEWREKTLFTGHLEFFASAVAAYERGDYIGCISTVLPRIEGLLRALYLGPKDSPKQADLSGALAQAIKDRHPASTLFMAERLKEYIGVFYFANFDQKSGHIPLSRHSVGHGVAESGSFDQRRALQSLLLIDQFFFCA